MGTPVQAGEPELVALAMTAGQERADLPPDGIPVSLLRKHLETIFARPGLSSRTGAVTRAFPTHLGV